MEQPFSCSGLSTTVTEPIPRYAARLLMSERSRRYMSWLPRTMKSLSTEPESRRSASDARSSVLTSIAERESK